MKISVNWLRNYVDLPQQQNWQDFGDLLTIRTAEIEEVNDLSKNLENIVVGQIEEIKPHPNADKLRITHTNTGDKTLQIICGANNIFEGQKVAVALQGAKVRWHGEGELVTLEPTKIRGEESFGMICAGSEIGIPDETEGILDLSHIKAPPGTLLAEALGKNDIIIDIENKTLTHRPDLWGHYGMAREIAAITDQSLKPIDIHTKYDDKLPNIIDIDVQEPQLCPRYVTVTIDGISVAPSPTWLKTALENTGNSSINNIVDATNFVMLELGNPLHAFDTSMIKNNKIVVRKAKNGEIIETLDKEKKELTSDTLIISDSEKVLAIAGIKGGLHSGIHENTTCITLEAANFNPISIRKSSTRLGIRTESVQRFEKSLDPILAEQALDRAVKLILDLCPNAKIISKKQDINNFTYKPQSISLDLKKVSSKIGVEINANTATNLLKKLEFKVEKVKNDENTLKIIVPSFRSTGDISHQDDLIEEIARLYGYEKIQALVPKLPTRPPIHVNTELKEINFIRDILSLELGFNETINYSFYSKNTIKKCRLNEEAHLKIKNYLSEEQTHLRVDLIPNLLHNATTNIKNIDHIKFYEIGRTYKIIDKYFPLEEKIIAGLILKSSKNKNLNENPFYKAKTALGILLNRLDIKSLQYRKSESKNPLAHPTKHAAWFDHKSQKEVIQLFKLHPLIAQNFELEKTHIACFSINFSELHNLARENKKYRQIPRFPSMELDISILVPINTEVEIYKKAIHSAEKELIDEISLFDFYQGEGIPSDKKSLTYKIIFRSENRTLTDAEIKNSRENIFQSLQKVGAEIRGL